ncbi:hypothetical protein Fmac_013424 [Flemingia macrophylla]|uniref:Uncharacterized protein n=1 Tax=Flemingia macrophylla TaxID=520843 RepID=A0ABD1MT39_9FABA
MGKQSRQTSERGGVNGGAWTTSTSRRGKNGRESVKPRGQRRKREEEDNPRIKVGLVLTSLIKLSFKGHESLSDTGVVPPLTPSSGNSSPNSPTGPTQCLNASTAASLNLPSTPSIYITDDSDNDGGNLSPPSNNSGDDGGNIEGEESNGENDEDERRQNDPYQDIPYNRRDTNLVIDFTTSIPGMIPPDHSFPHNSRDNSQAMRGKKKQNVSHEEYSSSSHIEQSFSDFNIDNSSESSQGHYPPSVYQYPYFNAYNPYASGQVPSYHQPSVNSHSPYYQQQSSGFFDYVFGQGATQGDSQSESGYYDQPRHSTICDTEHGV